MILVLFLVGRTDASSPNNWLNTSGVERLLLRLPFLVLGAGAVITGIVGSGCCRAFPLLLDLGFDGDVSLLLMVLVFLVLVGLVLAFCF